MKTFSLFLLIQKKKKKQILRIILYNRQQLGNLSIIVRYTFIYHLTLIRVKQTSSVCYTIATISLTPKVRPKPKRSDSSFFFGVISVFIDHFNPFLRSNWEFYKNQFSYNNLLIRFKAYMTGRAINQLRWKFQGDLKWILDEKKKRWCEGRNAWHAFNHITKSPWKRWIISTKT